MAPGRCVEFLDSNLDTLLFAKHAVDVNACTTKLRDFLNHTYNWIKHRDKFLILRNLQPFHKVSKWRTIYSIYAFAGTWSFMAKRTQKQIDQNALK